MRQPSDNILPIFVNLCLIRMQDFILLLENWQVWLPYHALILEMDGVVALPKTVESFSDKMFRTPNRIVLHKTLTTVRDLMQWSAKGEMCIFWETPKLAVLNFVGGEVLWWQMARIGRMKYSFLISIFNRYRQFFWAEKNCAQFMVDLSDEKCDQTNFLRLLLTYCVETVETEAL